MKRPIVAIVGRPNVGKSSFFNCITKKKIAVVHDQPGVTRDRIYADVEWENCHFTVVDTGGLDLNPGDDLIDMVQLQAEAALNEASIILFVVDVRTGIMPADLMVADKLRRTNKPIFLVVNKVDSERFVSGVAEFY